MATNADNNIIHVCVPKTSILIMLHLFGGVQLWASQTIEVTSSRFQLSVNVTDCAKSEVTNLELFVDLTAVSVDKRQV